MRLKDKLTPYLFLLPSLIILSIFLFYPLFSAVKYSFFDFSLLKGTNDFIGLGNYIELFSDEKFKLATLNTFYFTVVSVPLQVILALFVAVSLTKLTKFNTFLRAVYFLPSIISMTVVSIVWSFLINSDIGVFSYFVSLFGLSLPDLLNSPIWAMPTVILITIWKNFGFSMVIILAGLQQVPSEQYEAVKIDGANVFTTFFKVTLPQIVPTLGFVIITTTISSFQVFDQIYILTQGGPLFRTETLVQYIYSTAFESYQLGYASAISIVLLVIIMVLSLIMFKTMRRYEV